MYPVTLVRFSQNTDINFELRDGRTVSGKLVKCDQFMNLHLSNATIKALDGPSQLYGECFFYGHSIRMVEVEPRLLHKQYIFNRTRRDATVQTKN